MRIEINGIEAAGDWMLAAVEYVGRVKASELEVRQASWELLLWTHGLCRRYEVHWDREQSERAFQERAAEAVRR